MAREPLTSWREDPDLAGLRDPQPLAKFREMERRECRALWLKLTPYFAPCRNASD